MNRLFLEFRTSVKMPSTQIATPGNCTTKGHVQNPELRGAFGLIESSAEAMNQQEDVLNKVIRLGCVLQDSQRYSAYEMCVATKKGRKRFPAPKANFGDQGLVRNVGF